MRTGLDWERASEGKASAAAACTVRRRVADGGVLMVVSFGCPASRWSPIHRSWMSVREPATHRVPNRLTIRAEHPRVYPDAALRNRGHVGDPDRKRQRIIRAVAPFRESRMSSFTATMSTDQ